MKNIIVDCSTGTCEVVDLTPEEAAVIEADRAAYELEASERLKKAIVDATEAQLNEFARTRGYDSIMSACTYATSTVPKFAAEGQYCVELRDQTWAVLYTMLAEVQSGTRPVPSSFEDIASILPTATATWPE